MKPGDWVLWEGLELMAWQGDETALIVSTADALHEPFTIYNGWIPVSRPELDSLALIRKVFPDAETVSQGIRSLASDHVRHGRPQKKGLR